MKDDYFKTLGIAVSVMYVFSFFLALSFVFDKKLHFLEALPLVLDFVNLALGISFIFISLLFFIMSVSESLKAKKNKKTK